MKATVHFIWRLGRRGFGVLSSLMLRSIGTWGKYLIDAVLHQRRTASIWTPLALWPNTWVTLSSNYFGVCRYLPIHTTRWPSRSADTAACILNAFNHCLDKFGCSHNYPNDVFPAPEGPNISVTFPRMYPPGASWPGRLGTERTVSSCMMPVDTVRAP